MTSVKNYYSNQFTTRVINMPSTAQGWLNARFPQAQVATPFILSQSQLQTYFAGQLGTIGNVLTRRVVKKGIWRVGKLLWGASMPVAQNGARFAGWTKTKRSTNSEQNITMNCWEAVLYLAYQCDVISKQKCITFYGLPTASDLKLRALFGAATQFNPLVGAVPNMGDIIAFEDTANGNIINHVALYAGVFGGQHYVLHNLSYHAHTTGLQMGGGFHFESLHSLRIRYGQNLNIYYTQPFWVPGSPTYNYYSLL